MAFVHLTLALPTDPAPSRRLPLGAGLAHGLVQWLVVMLAIGGFGLIAGCGSRSFDPGVPQPSTGQFGEPGMSPGQLAYPRVLETSTHDGRTDLWIIDKAGRVQWFEEGQSRPRALWMMPKRDIGVPTGMAIHYDEQGPLLFIADTHEHGVLVQRPPSELGADAETITSFGSYGYGLGELIYPCDVEILTDGSGAIERIYVSEYGGNDRVTAFDAQLQPLFSFGTYGNPWDAEGEQSGAEIVFNRPQSIAIDREARVLYIADSINHRVGRFTLDGDLLGWLGDERPSSAPGRFRFPFSLEVLEDGSLLVCEYGNSRVQRIDPQTGEVLGLFGEPGRGPGQVLNPWSVALTPERIWVLDSGNARVLSFARPSPDADLRSRRSDGQVAGR